MAVTVAGVTVKEGDRVYHAKYQQWVTVVRIDGPTGYVDVPSLRQPLPFTDGGKVQGVKQLYWHEPLALDLPTSDISKYQRLVNALVEVGL